MQSVKEELESLRAVVEDLTSLRSRWNGRVALIDDADLHALRGRLILAEKSWSCDILINTAIVEEPWGWRTYLHELIHSVSVGSNEADYRRFRGWEGVVEWMQRHLRPEALAQIGVDVSEDVFQTIEASWPYDPYMEALASLQEASSVDAETFYAELLRTPLSQRLNHTRALKDTAEYRYAFAVTRGKLR